METADAATTSHKTITLPQCEDSWPVTVSHKTITLPHCGRQLTCYSKSQGCHFTTLWRQLTCYSKSQGCHFTTMWRQLTRYSMSQDYHFTTMWKHLTCYSQTEGYHFTTNVYHSSATADLVSGGVTAQWVLCGQHSTGDEDAGQHHIAEVRVVTDPVAQHAEPETLEPQVTHCCCYKPGNTGHRPQVTYIWVTNHMAQSTEPETFEPQVTHSVVVTSLATQDTNHRLHTAFEL